LSNLILRGLRARGDERYGGGKLLESLELGRTLYP